MVNAFIFITVIDGLIPYICLLLIHVWHDLVVDEYICDDSLSTDSTTYNKIRDSPLPSLLDGGNDADLTADLPGRRE